MQTNKIWKQYIQTSQSLKTIHPNLTKFQNNTSKPHKISKQYIQTSQSLKTIHPNLTKFENNTSKPQKVWKQYIQTSPNLKTIHPNLTKFQNNTSKPLYLVLMHERSPWVESSLSELIILFWGEYLCYG